MSFNGQQALFEETELENKASMNITVRSHKPAHSFSLCLFRTYLVLVTPVGQEGRLIYYDAKDTLEETPTKPK